MNKNILFYLSVFTLFGFSFVGYLILSFSDQYNYNEIFNVEAPVLSTIIGLGFGLAVAFLGWLILQASYFDKVNQFFGDFFSKLELSWPDVLFYSFCAGVGEEILFRGAIQPFIGIWPTALVFVLLHGYITPKDIPKSVYGVFLVLISAGFGYLMKYYGIYAAAAAHFIYDVVMFGFLKIQNDKQRQAEPDEDE
ncbi:MAG: CPBP family intramembrane glutamic endopeptidase [Bacteroidota bacterium]